MKKLNENEIIEFTKKYLPDWLGDIKKVTLIDFDNIKEFLVNDHYIIVDNGKEVFHDDLQ